MFQSLLGPIRRVQLRLIEMSGRFRPSVTFGQRGGHDGHPPWVARTQCELANALGRANLVRIEQSDGGVMAERTGETDAGAVAAPAQEAGGRRAALTLAVLFAVCAVIMLAPAPAGLPEAGKRVIAVRCSRSGCGAPKRCPPP